MSNQRVKEDAIMEWTDSGTLTNNLQNSDKSGVDVALQKDIPHEKSSSITTYKVQEKKDIREDLVRERSVFYKIFVE